MLELIQKIKLYTEAGVILEHMELFDEVESMVCENCIHDSMGECEKLVYFTDGGYTNSYFETENIKFCDMWEKKLLLTREEYKKMKEWKHWGSMQEQNYMDYAIDAIGEENAKHI